MKIRTIILLAAIVVVIGIAIAEWDYESDEDNSLIKINISKNSTIVKGWALIDEKAGEIWATKNAEFKPLENK